MSDRSLFVRCGEGNALFGTAGGGLPSVGGMFAFGLRYASAAGVEVPGGDMPPGVQKGGMPSPAALGAPRSIHMHFIHMHFTLLTALRAGPHLAGV